MSNSLSVYILIDQDVMHVTLGARLKFSKNKLDERWRCERCSFVILYAEFMNCLLYDLTYLAYPTTSPESPISWICDTAEKKQTELSWTDISFQAGIDFLS